MTSEERAREAVRAMHAAGDPYDGDKVLAAAIREAEERATERACEAVCVFCRLAADPGDDVLDTPATLVDGRWEHVRPDGGPNSICWAAKIRALGDR